METPLLATKLFIPPAPQGALQRPRLLEKLNGALSNRLVLVCAPAGFGKTTLLSQWLHAQQPAIPAGWLSLEETENDPGAFWEYFVAAVQSAGNAAINTSESLARSSEPLPNESIVSILINDQGLKQTMVGRR